MRTDRRQPSKIGVLLRRVLYALAIAFMVGFVVGTLIRRELSRPIRYIGAQPPVDSTLAPHPGDVLHIEARILVPSHHEEQV
jgi:hypothetical protein